MEWLRAIRRERGLSQCEVSKRAGITQQYYSSIERGKRGQTLPAPTAKRIACILDFPWTKFFDESAPTGKEGEAS